MSTQLTPTRHAIVLSPPKSDGDFSHVNPQRTASKDIRIGGREMVAEVVAMVQERTLDGAAMARRHLRPVTLSVGQGDAKVTPSTVVWFGRAFVYLPLIPMGCGMTK